MTATTTLTSSPRPADATTGRHVTQVVVGRAVSDGDGVKLKRVIGQPSLDMLDPFLMLDEFGSDDPGAYIGGFPAHPHRGFETVSYMLRGRMLCESVRISKLLRSTIFSLSNQIQYVRRYDSLRSTT